MPLALVSVYRSTGVPSRVLPKSVFATVAFLPFAAARARPAGPGTATGPSRRKQTKATRICIESSLHAGDETRAVAVLLSPCLGSSPRWRGPGPAGVRREWSACEVVRDL